MEYFVQRWLASRPSVRLVCWCTAAGVIGLAVWALTVRPAWRQCAELGALSLRAARTNVALWPQARRHPLVSKARVTQDIQPFSPLDYQGKGTRLVHWKPQQNGGELALSAPWSEIPALFSRLATQAVKVRAFTLVPEEGQLRLSLQLETDRAH